MVDGGEVTVEVNYDGTAAGTANVLAGLVTNTATQTVVVQFNGAATSKWQGAGFVTGIGHAIPFDDKVTQTVNVKFAGAIAYTDEA
jgi:hypothetical protein